VNIIKLFIYAVLSERFYPTLLTMRSKIILNFKIKVLPPLSYQEACHKEYPRT
jgi:hypothetical protein